MSNLNISAIKKHALACSVAIRNGRFTRVGQDVIDELEGDVEALVREIKGKYPVLIHSEVFVNDTFITGALIEKIKVELNAAIGRLIQNKVGKQPSVGVTIGRTR